MTGKGPSQNHYLPRRAYVYKPWYSILTYAEILVFEILKVPGCLKHQRMHINVQPYIQTSLEETEVD